MLDSKRGQVKLEDIPGVKEFPYVFLEELLGLPPEREVDLFIEIYRGQLLSLGHLTVWLQLN